METWGERGLKATGFPSMKCRVAPLVRMLYFDCIKSVHTETVFPVT